MARLWPLSLVALSLFACHPTDAAPELASVSAPLVLSVAPIGTTTRLAQPIKPPPPLGDIAALDVEDAFAFVARRGTNTEGSQHELEIASILTSPPWLFARLNLPEAPLGVRVRDEVAYVWTAGSLMLVDVTSPNRPVIAATLPLGDDLRGVALEGERAFVAHWSGLVSVVDIADTGAPTLVHTLNTGAANDGVTAEPGRLYVGTFDNHIHVFDTESEEAPTLLYVRAGSSYGGPFHVRDGRLLSQGVNDETFQVYDLSADADEGTTAQLFYRAPGVRATDIAGNDGLLLSQDGMIHRVSFGPELKPVQRVSLPSPLSLNPNLQAFVAFGRERAVVAVGKQYAVRSVAPPPCAYSGPLQITFDSAPTERYPGHVPWTTAEEDYLRRTLGVVETATGQQCVGLGLIDRLTRFLGQPDQLEPAGIPTLIINFVKDPGYDVAGGTTGNDDYVRVTMRVFAHETLDQQHLSILSHELTHAMTRLSFPTFSLLVTEGIAVAGEMSVTDELFTHGGMSQATKDCAALNVPGISMYHGTAWNAPIDAVRYIASGCFLLRQQRAHQALGNPNYFNELRTRTRAIATPTEPTVGAHLMRQAIADSAPSCIENLSGQGWLAQQHIFQMEPELPALEVYAARAGFRAAGMRLFAYKRSLNSFGWGQEEVPDLDAMQQIADPLAFFAGSLTASWALKDEFGNSVGALERQFEVSLSPWFTGRPYFHPPSTSDSAELPHCASDVDGDGEARCRTSRVGRVRVDYTDPTAGTARTLERSIVSYRVHTNRRAPIVGVASSFLTGTVRVTFPLLGVATETQVEGGVFLAPGHNSAFYQVSEPVCSVMANSRDACRLGSNRIGCTQTPQVNPPPDLRSYRGPVRVEQLITGFFTHTLKNPKTYSKLWDELELVY